MAYQETYTRAFNTILNRLFSFPTLSDSKWKSELEILPKVGDFITLQAAPATEWQFSWVFEVYEETESVLLRSAMTGKLCKWSNVGFQALKRSEVLEKFKWTDRQYDFSDKFDRAIKRNYDHRLAFGGLTFDGFKVTCSLRERFSMFNSSPDKAMEITFDDFRKVKASMLNDFYITHSKKLERQKNGK